LVPKVKVNFLAFLLIAATFIATGYLDVLSEIQKWLGRLANIEIGVAFCLPLLLMMLLLVQRYKRRKVSE
jgi:hypothetical protein